MDGKRVFIIDMDEMRRRRVAYTTLIISVFSGCLLSALLFFGFKMILAVFFPVLALLLFYSRVQCFRAFKKFMETKVVLDDHHIERIRPASSMRYPLDSVTGIRVKRTTRGLIRAIQLQMVDKGQPGITTLDKIEAFERELRKRISPSARVLSVKEPIDYDHPLFYVYFGLSVGFVMSGIMKLITVLDTAVLHWIQFSCIAFVFSAGIFWLVCMPLKRYGYGKKYTDALFGTFLVLTAVGLGLYSLASGF